MIELSRYLEMSKLKEDMGAVGVAGVPVNNMGTSSSTAGTGGIDTYDPLLKRKKKLREIIRRKPPNG
jgi:hypothetical protein